MGSGKHLKLVDLRLSSVANLDLTLSAKELEEYLVPTVLVHSYDGGKFEVIMLRFFYKACC